MLKKLILSVIVISALIGAGFGFAYKDDVSLANSINKYHAAMDGKDYAGAYTLANRMAADGYLPAHTFLAGLYENGTGVLQNIDIAVEQYKLAATAGDVTAQTYLAGLYLSGVGVQKDAILAAHWLEKAAVKNSAKAQFELGRLYQNGTLNTEDPYKARALLTRASEQGVSEATIVLADMTSLDMGLR